MIKRNHYEAAFESFLRKSRVPFIGVNESRRNLLPDGQSIKNLDFVVSVPNRQSWLVDVKGRKFPSGKEHHSYWKNWTTHDDLTGMAHWQNLFGNHYSGLFVFAYWICGNRSPLPPEELFEFRGEHYGFIAVPFFDYLSCSRLISPRWKTYAMPTRKFRSVAKPFGEFI
ncbi:MAG: HYExAFE family protein [Thermoguttaceae bacterium]